MKVILNYRNASLLIMLFLYHQTMPIYAQDRKLPEFLGQAYDIFLGNPLGPSADPGYHSKMVFEFTYSNDRITSDGLFLYPAEASVTPLTSCEIQTQTDEIYGMTSYHKTLAASIKVSGSVDLGIGGASFTSSFGYKQAEDELKEHQNVNILVKASCELYRGVLQTTQKLSQDFKDAVARTQETGNWTEFLDDWGTHYGYSVSLGAAGIGQTIYSFENYQTLKAYQIDVSHVAEARYKVAKFGIDYEFQLTNSQETALNESHSQTSEYYLGYPPPADRQLTTWISEIQNGYPTVLRSEVKLIADLFTTDYFGDLYSPEDLLAFRQSYENAIIVKVNSSGIIPSDLDIPSPNVLVSESRVMGGSGGADFRDFAITDASAKLASVKYAISEEGYFIGMSLVLTGGQQTQWHGSYAPNTRSMDVGSKPIGGVTVFQTPFDDSYVVIGIQFKYEDGGVSDLMGQQSHNWDYSSIQGSIFGLKGRCYDFLDSVGFLSNVLSLDPKNNPKTVRVFSMAYGTSKGQFFNSLSDTDNSWVCKIITRSGWYIDQIQVLTWLGLWSPVYGGSPAPDYHEIDLCNSKLVSIQIRWAWYIDALSFTFADGTVVGAGGTGGTYSSMDVEADLTLVGIAGYYGDYVNNLSFIFSRTG